MDRRETIKSMLIGGLAGGGLLIAGCDPKTGEPQLPPEAKDSDFYGRTEKEVERDKRIKGETFLSEHEIATIAVLSDLILPATATAASAKEAGVPEFIAFIVKDIKSHQIPLHGGLMWLDHQAMTAYNNAFVDCAEADQKKILDTIAYPKQAAPEVQQGVKFFTLMRNLVLTGYYTTKIGIDDLGYKGNVANVWDGVPEEVLSAHGLSYDTEWLAKCVDQEKRNVQADWDDEGNLIS